MGEVRRARDTRLHRDVALKILPDDFAVDPDRLARFQREAQVLASLDHHGIAEPVEPGVGLDVGRPAVAVQGAYAERWP
jgi:serine/threonine protein kinase